MVDKIQPYNLPLWLFRDKTLKQILDLICELGTIEQNLLTPNSRIYVALEPKNKYLLKPQQYNMIIVCRKLVMHMEQAQCDQARMELSINHDLTKQKITLT